MILDVREFRISNRVARAGAPDTHCVINSTMLYRWSIGEEVRDYTPIPISAASLERLGFDIGPDMKMRFKISEEDWLEYTVPQAPGRERALYWCCKSFGVKRHLDFLYLHEIQNFYYLLTGSEIK